MDHYETKAKVSDPAKDIPYAALLQKVPSLRQGRGLYCREIYRGITDVGRGLFALVLALRPEGLLDDPLQETMK